MKKKVLAVTLATVLALSLGLVFAVPVYAADYTDSYYSDDTGDDATDAFGYTRDNPSGFSDVLNEDEWDDDGHASPWATAVDLSKHPAWYPEDSATDDTEDSFWISNALGWDNMGSEGVYTENAWRLFRQEFSVPSWAVNISGTVHMAADNDGMAYLNDSSTVIIELGDVYGPKPASQPEYFANWYASGPFTPDRGDNTVYFVVRNWNGTNPRSHPTGLLYRVDREYDEPSLGDLDPEEDYNPVCTYHTVSVMIDPAEEGVEVHFDIDGPNSVESGSGTTDADGIAWFTYHGENPGTDVITAYIDLNDNDQLDEGEPISTNTATKYWLEHFVTGGGIITEGRGKDAYKITFGGNVGYDLEGNEVGQWNINIHNVNDPDFNKGHFHSTEITDIGFFDIADCPEPDPPDADYNYAHFVATGRFNGEDGWELRFNMTDYGEGNKLEPDGIRVRLWNASNVLVYDSSETGEYYTGVFTNEGDCALARRTRLDGGNIQIHPPEIPTP